jgi:hypothetical protein
VWIAGATERREIDSSVNRERQSFQAICGGQGDRVIILPRTAGGAKSATEFDE